MPLHESQTLTVAIHCPFERANAYLCQPPNFAQWAAGLGSGVQQRNGRWFAQTPAGEVEIQFTDPNPFGVLDHTVFIPNHPPVYVPLRVISNGDGCQVTLTLFRTPDFTDDKFAQDVQLVRQDLATLKNLLEHPADSAPPAPPRTQ